jgi:hypothetical protein
MYIYFLLKHVQKQAYKQAVDENILKDHRL